MPDALGRALLTLARNAIAEDLGLPTRPVETLRELDEPGATFVTLQRREALRGCIGSLVPYRTLAEDVRENARRAAFSDPRFLPVTAEELPTLDVEVSLLTAPERMSFRDEEDALAQLQPGEDGLILNVRGRRATFLPQVWEKLEEPREFLAQLKQKAGLPPDFWSPDVELERYRVRKWKETDQ